MLMNCIRQTWRSRRVYSEMTGALHEMTEMAEMTASEASAASPRASKTRLSAAFEMGRNGLGVSTVPSRLQLALERVLKGYPRRQLRQDVATLSESYAQMTKIAASTLLDTNFEESSRWSETERQAVVQFSSPAVEYGPRETFAYVASQLPFALAPLQRVFAEMARRMPQFVPQTMLDFGTGPGTAVWAAHERWSGSLRRAIGVDVSQPMLEMAAELLKDHETLQPLVQFRRFMAMSPDRPKHDLVVAAMVLSELADDHLRGLSVDHLWDQTGDVLVLIERGNAEGFRLVRNARTRLLRRQEMAAEETGNRHPEQEDANSHSARENVVNTATPRNLHIVAPCAHERPCPMVDGWCHFAQRVQLNPFQNELFNLPKGFEDQKFSYLVVRRGERPVPTSSAQHADASFSWPRLARPSIKRSGHVIHDVCSATGRLERFVVAKSHGRQEYYDARKAKWGDLWPHPVQTTAKPLVSFKRPSRRDGK